MTVEILWAKISLSRVKRTQSYILDGAITRSYQYLLQPFTASTEQKNPGQLDIVILKVIRQECTLLFMYY